MPLARPVDAYAIDNLITALSGITVANGYAVTITPVTYDPNGIDHNDGTAYVESTGETPLPTSPCTREDFYVNVRVVVFIQPLQVEGGDVGVSGATARSIEERMRTYSACIRKALMADVHRGGYAINTRFDDPTEYEPETLPMYVRIPIKLHIRTMFGDRFTQG
jgi:hypothetical protein